MDAAGRPTRYAAGDRAAAWQELRLQGDGDSEAIQGYVEVDHDGWADGPTRTGCRRLRAPLAPDALHKSNTSGGDPYGLVLPDRGVDGSSSGETVVSVVAYLDDVFAHGGFPGVAADDEVGRRVTQALARDLLPL